MTDILDTLKTYPDDPTVVMSRRVVNETISEIERLRAELADMKSLAYDRLLQVEAAETERDELRAELAAANDMKRRMTDACEEANKVAEQYRAELAAAQLAADLIAQQGADLCTKYIKERDTVAIRLENALNEGAQRRAERDTLRAELAAVRKQHDANGKASRDRAEHIYKVRTKLNAAEAERDELRAELAKRDEVMKEAQEKLQPISALVDMTPSGFPDHDICPIRLGMARDLRELRSRIDAALGGGDEKA